jgi:selenocysteine lyase/cysteine desulfurase
MSENLQTLFHPNDGIYLLSHSVGRPPLSVKTAFEQHFLTPWLEGGEEVWPKWLQGIEAFRAALARLLNTGAANLCPQLNLSSALTKILASRAVDEKRPVILCCEEDFPSMVFVLQQMQHLGYSLRILRDNDERLLDVDYWQQQMSDDVGVLLLAHVQSNTGYQLPVAEICAAAHERGVLSIVDVAQSTGVLPIDLQQWSADFVIGSTVKWLCGGPGAGFLWGSDQAIASSAPVDVGWFSHESPFEFDIDSFRYADDALRFWGGTPSVQPYIVAANSINTLCDIGIEAIRQHNLSLCETLINALDEGELHSPKTAQQRGGTLIVKPEATRAAAVKAKLDKSNVQFDERRHGLRLSPHIYNSAAEMAIVADCLRAG